MSATTPRLALEYPQDTDPADVPTYVEALANDLDPLVTAYASGTAAARPVTPTTGAGTLYLATDSLALSFYNGTAWVGIAPAVLLSTLLAKGDLLVASGAGAVARQAVGSDGLALLADSTQTNGVRWGQAGGVLADDPRAAIATANTWQNGAAYTPGTNSRLLCLVSFDIPSGGATVAAQVTYTRAGTARTDDIYPTGQGSLAQGAYAPTPLFIDADSGAAVTIQVQSSSTSTAVSTAIALP